MNLSELTETAMRVRQQFGALEKSIGGREWTREEVMQGFVVDVGALMKLVMAKAGIRNVENADPKLAHELSDCLWSVLVLAKLYGIDLEREYLTTMGQLETDLKTRQKG